MQTLGRYAGMDGMDRRVRDAALEAGVTLMPTINRSGPISALRQDDAASQVRPPQRRLRRLDIQEPAADMLNGQPDAGAQLEKPVQQPGIRYRQAKPWR
jgi:hypothetical protein